MTRTATATSSTATTKTCRIGWDQGDPTQNISLSNATAVTTPISKPPLAAPTAIVSVLQRQQQQQHQQRSVDADTAATAAALTTAAATKETRASHVESLQQQQQRDEQETQILSTTTTTLTGNDMTRVTAASPPVPPRVVAQVLMPATSTTEGAVCAPPAFDIPCSMTPLLTSSPRSRKTNINSDVLIGTTPKPALSVPDEAARHGAYPQQQFFARSSGAITATTTAPRASTGSSSTSHHNPNGTKVQPYRQLYVSTAVPGGHKANLRDGGNNNRIHGNANGNHHSSTSSSSSPRSPWKHVASPTTATSMRRWISWSKRRRAEMIVLGSLMLFCWLIVRQMQTLFRRVTIYHQPWINHSSVLPGGKGVMATAVQGSVASSSSSTSAGSTSSRKQLVVQGGFRTPPGNSYPTITKISITRAVEDKNKTKVDWTLKANQQAALDLAMQSFPSKCQGKERLLDILFAAEYQALTDWYEKYLFYYASPTPSVGTNTTMSGNMTHINRTVASLWIVPQPNMTRNSNDYNHHHFGVNVSAVMFPFEDTMGKICDRLPLWQEVVDLYGEEPVIFGMETCPAFRSKIKQASITPKQERRLTPGMKTTPSLYARSYALSEDTLMKQPIAEPLVRVAGLFNTGTNALYKAVHYNLPRSEASKVFLPQEPDRPLSGEQFDVFYRVPWGKHIPITYRGNITMKYANWVNLDHVLPLVLVRDPYRWMKAMCAAPYDAKWLKAGRACPNLIRDVARYQKGLTNATFQVTVKYETFLPEQYDTLADWWSDWNRRYMERTDVPKLMIRLEDTLFHAEAVMKKIADCVGLNFQEPYKYLLTRAKNHGRTTNFLDALIRYGSARDRYSNMTPYDLEYATHALDPAIMKAFGYKYYNESASVDAMARLPAQLTADLPRKDDGFKRPLPYRRPPGSFLYHRMDNKMHDEILNQRRRDILLKHQQALQARRERMNGAGGGGDKSRVRPVPPRRPDLLTGGEGGAILDPQDSVQNVPLNSRPLERRDYDADIARAILEARLRAQVQAKAKENKK